MGQIKINTEIVNFITFYLTLLSGFFSLQLLNNPEKSTK